jgi:hypothetical protein
LATSTLIILFSEKFLSKKEKTFCEGKNWIFRSILFLKIKNSKLINWLFILWTCVEVRTWISGGENNTIVTKSRVGNTKFDIM